MINWTLQQRSISELVPHEHNPRQLSKEQAKQLKRSISKYGLIDKPVITHDNRIIGGHQRIKVLRDMGHTHVECYVAQDKLSDDDIKELLIRLNKNTGDWDWDVLANVWERDSLLEWGFSAGELEGKIEKVDLSTNEEGIEGLVNKETISKRGDVYLLGEHRLMCGDSTNAEDVGRLLDGGEPVLMVTDPPYGVSYDPQWRNTSIFAKAKRATGKVTNDDQADWSLAWALFPGNVAYVWHSAKHSPVVAKSLTDNSYELIAEIIWAKHHFAISRGDYHWQHEPCWYAVRKGCKHNWQGSRKESTVWEISNNSAFGSKNNEEATGHGTQKPLECMARPIRNSSAEGESVYDPFVGSGTTLIACEKLNRKCYAMEIDPVYCDIVVARWEKETGKKAVKCGQEDQKD